MSFHFTDQSGNKVAGLTLTANGVETDSDDEAVLGQVKFLNGLKNHGMWA